MKNGPRLPQLSPADSAYKENKKESDSSDSIKNTTVTHQIEIISLTRLQAQLDDFESWINEKKTRLSK